MRRSLTAAVLLASSTACWPGPLTIDVPFEAGAHSAVIAVEPAEAAATLYAVDPEHRNAMALLTSVSHVSDDRSLRVTVVSFSEPLESLGLVPGVLDSVEGGRPLPTDSLGQRQLEVGSGAASDWQQVAERPQVLRDFLRPAQPNCRPLRVEQRWEFTEASHGVAGLVRLGSREVAFVAKTALDEAVLYMGHEDGSIERFDSVPAQVMNVYEARTDAFDRIWFVGRFPGGGRIARREVSGDLQILASVTSTPADDSTFLSFRFGANQDPDTLYLVSQDGGLWRYHDGLQLLSPGPKRGEHRPALALIHEDDLLFTQPGGAALLRYKVNVAYREQTVLDGNLDSGSDNITALNLLANGDGYAGSFGGELLQRGLGGTWATVGSASVVTSAIWVIEPYREGVVALGAFGLVQQFYPEQGVCAERVYTNNLDSIFYGWVTGDEIWVAGFNNDPDGPRPFMVHVVPAP